MNIIEKKKLAMDKIMAIPLEDWKYEFEDELIVHCYKSEYNGVELSLMFLRETCMLLAKEPSGERRVIVDSQVPNLFFNVSSFHNNKDAEYIEGMLDKINK